ncbi:IPTL-CTERM sorting domain-containing protein [Brevundimonas staleyi]|uniref:IPTL-CTERM sorting domain-containing protein n=1 Tax=Brevundimonas staleyi TaxID=74326 RepID=A0ABW0FTY6_9CAUL
MTTTPKMMRAAAFLFALLLVNLSVGQAVAQTTRYVVTSQTYNGVDNSMATPCELAPCPSFTTSMKIQGSITFAAPLAPNLSVADIPASQIVAYHFEDGVTTYDKSDPRSRIFVVKMSTDGAGAVTNFDIRFNRWNVAPGTGDVTGRLGYFEARPAAVSALANMQCMGAPSTSTSSGETDTCSSVNFGADTVVSQNIGGVVTFVLAPAPPVPTLSEWAMILLGLTLAGAAAVVIQRRRMTA